VSIGAKNPMQMRFIQDDEVVHTLAPDRSDAVGKPLLAVSGSGNIYFIAKLNRELLGP
jgi:hypothetical protein